MATVTSRANQPPSEAGLLARAECIVGVGERQKPMKPSRGLLLISLREMKRPQRMSWGRDERRHELNGLELGAGEGADP